MEKVLRSLSKGYDYVIPSIEVVYDSDKLTPVKLMGLLQSHEERLNSRSSSFGVTKNVEIQEEQVLQVFQDSTKSNYERGRGHGSPRGRGAGRGGRVYLDRSKVPQCYICKKYGHMKKECWYNTEEPQANVAENEESNEVSEEENAKLLMTFHELPKECLSLMTHTNETVSRNLHLWFIDSGCSNHMTGSKNSFTYLDERFKLSVQLGDKKMYRC